MLFFQTAYRGVKNPEAVEKKRKKQEEIEKQAMTTSVSGGGGGLKVSAVFSLNCVISVLPESQYRNDYWYSTLFYSKISYLLCFIKVVCFKLSIF